MSEPPPTARPFFEGAVTPEQFRALDAEYQRLLAQPKPGHHPSMTEPKYANNHPMHPDNIYEN